MHFVFHTYIYIYIYIYIHIMRNAIYPDIVTGTTTFKLPSGLSNQLYMVIFHSCVSLPEGRLCGRPNATNLCKQTIRGRFIHLFMVLTQKGYLWRWLVIRLVLRFTTVYHMNWYMIWNGSVYTYIYT